MLLRDPKATHQPAVVFRRGSAAERRPRSVPRNTPTGRKTDGGQACQHQHGSLGFRHCRVRHHGDVARLELDADDMARAAAGGTRDAIVRDLKAIGYRYVSLDLQGYRTGSLNEVLPLRPLT